MKGIFWKIPKFARFRRLFAETPLYSTCYDATTSSCSLVTTTLNMEPGNKWQNNKELSGVSVNIQQTRANVWHFPEKKLFTCILTYCCKWKTSLTESFSCDGGFSLIQVTLYHQLTLSNLKSRLNDTDVVWLRYMVDSYDEVISDSTCLRSHQMYDSCCYRMFTRIL